MNEQKLPPWKRVEKSHRRRCLARALRYDEHLNQQVWHHCHLNAFHSTSHRSNLDNRVFKDERPDEEVEAWFTSVHADYERWGVPA